MPIMLTRKDGPPTPFRNAEYIPFYYFIPKSILSRCGAELNAIPRNPQELFHNAQHPYTRALLAAVPRLGSMQGTPLPRKFDLLRVDTPEAPAEVAPPQDTVRPETPILRVRDLVTRFDVHGGFFGRVKRRVHAVEKVSFDLYPGETLALVGESGCGKTTVGKAVLQLIKPTGGAVRLAGKELVGLSRGQMRPLRRRLQMIFQDPFASLNPYHTIRHHIERPLRLDNVVPKDQIDAEVRRLLFAGRYAEADALAARQEPSRRKDFEAHEAEIGRALLTLRAHLATEALLPEAEMANADSLRNTFAALALRIEGWELRGPDRR